MKPIRIITSQYSTEIEDKAEELINDGYVLYAAMTSAPYTTLVFVLRSVKHAADTTTYKVEKFYSKRVDDK